MTDFMHPSDLVLLRNNPRRGRVDFIADLLRANGIMDTLTVNRGTLTGRPNEVLSGNHTLKAIRLLADENPNDERWQRVPVLFVDVDDDHARRYAVSNNRASEVGENDDLALLEFLTELPTLDGTGYVEADLDELRGLMDGPSLDDLLDDDGPADELVPVSLSLKVEPHTKRLWDKYRKDHPDDDSAMATLLDRR